MRTQSLSLLLATLGLTALGAAGATAATPTNAKVFGGKTSDPYTLALRAYVYGQPLVAASQGRLQSTNPANPFKKRAANDGTAAINNLGFQRVLSNPQSKGTTPNNTTLYSQGWLDTDKDAYVLLTPDFGSRYYTFQMAQADTTTRESLGARVNGSKLQPVFIYGKHYRGKVPKGMKGVRSTFRYFFLLGRILVDPDKPGDTQAVRALQDQVKLVSWSRYRQGARGGRNAVSRQAPLDRRADGKRFAFLYELARTLKDTPPAARDRALVASFRRLGLTTKGFDPRKLSAADRRRVLKALGDGAKLVTAASERYGKVRNGWSYDFAGPTFGRDYLRRAVISKVLPFLNLTHETIYPKATTDQSGKALTGSKSYTLHFAPGEKPPARFFWSLIAYDQAGHMVENAIHRYSFGNLTPGQIDNPDGSFDLVVSHTQPTGRLAANWLPAPAGRFFLVLRLFGAQQSAFSGAWKPPLVATTR